MKKELPNFFSWTISKHALHRLHPLCHERDRELSQGKLGEALVTILKGTDGVKGPRFILAPIMNRRLGKADARAREHGFKPASELVFAMRRDIPIVEDSEGPLDRFSAMRCEVLLLGGAKSPRSAKVALDALSAVLPSARRINHPRDQSCGRDQQREAGTSGGRTTQVLRLIQQEERKVVFSARKRLLEDSEVGKSCHSNKSRVPDVSPVAFEFDGSYFWIGSYNQDSLPRTRRYKNIMTGNSDISHWS